MQDTADVIADRFTQFDPFEDTESAGTLTVYCVSALGFTQFDPFEDTESQSQRAGDGAADEFHPIRSVRGY